MEMGLDLSIRIKIWALGMEGTKAWGGSVKKLGYTLGVFYFKLSDIRQTFPVI